MSDQRLLGAAVRAGLEAHERGDVNAAKTAFQRALAIAPADPDALNLYGATLVQAGEAQAGVQYLERAAQLRRNNAAFIGNLAHAYFALARYAEAGDAFRKAVRLDPRGLTFHLGLANSLAMQGQLAIAEDLLRKLAARFSDSTLVWFNLGNVQRDQQRLEEAATSFRRAVSIEPQHADARNSLASVLHSMMRFEEAEREYRDCLRIAPDFMMAQCNLASVVMDLGRFEEAADLCREIIKAAPELPLAHSFLAAALSHDGRLLDALASSAVAARLSPADAKITQTYAAALADIGRFAQSLRWFARSLALNNDLNSTHQLLAHALLGNGCFAEGWAEYRSRPWPNAFRAEYPALDLKQTLPAELRDRHICVMREQGLGDEIYFLRFAPALRAAGARITYCASSKIASLLARVPCFERITVEVIPPTDADDCILAGDLPHALSASPMSQLPQASPIATETPMVWPIRPSVFWPPPARPLELVPLAFRVDEMKARLANAGPGPYVGLTWRAGTPPAEQRAVIWVLHKEIGIGPLAAALEDTAGTFIALQRKPQPGEVDSLAAALGRPVHDFSDLNEDLEGMLALLTLLDEYIAVSNTNTHLRAGVGKSARVLVPSPPDWRWMMNHSRQSPWFPGFSVYRQSIQGDWQPALAQLKRDLEKSATYGVPD